MSFYLNWLEEMRSHYLYNEISKLETDASKKKMFFKLAQFAQKQADLWDEKMRVLGEVPKPFEPDTRCRIILSLVRYCGTKRLKLILSTMKIRGMSAYYAEPHTEHQHMGSAFANNLRAAVFGVNDGLMSNLCLILGMVGAQSDSHAVVAAGISGLLAGAFSMGAGEYVSVRSQRDVYEYQIAIEKQELEEYPEEEQQELSVIYQSRGLSKEDADQISAVLIKNPTTGLNTLAREELGLNPDELVSPVGACCSSFLAFAVGGLVPLLPFLFSGLVGHAAVVSASLTLSSLFLIGAILSLYTNQSPWRSGFRMLSIGAASGIGVFAIGYLINYFLL